MVHKYKVKDLNTFIRENDNKSTKYLEYLVGDDDDNERQSHYNSPAGEVFYRFILLLKLYFKKIP